MEGHAGRPIDPRILLGLWLLATLDGIGSARRIALSAWRARRTSGFAAAFPRKPTSGNRGRYEPTAKDLPEVAEWRRRMGTGEVQVAYRRRASTVECVNGTMKNRGLGRLVVRGLECVKAVAILHAITHNLGRAMRLGSRLVATP